MFARTFTQAKQERRKLSMVTCYDYSFARLLSQSPIDGILIGDSATAGHLLMLRREDVEVLAIGEVPEWETAAWVADAVAQGKPKALILIGHTPSEQAGMESCAPWLNTFIKEVPIGYVEAAEPFWNPR